MWNRALEFYAKEISSNQVIQFTTPKTVLMILQVRAVEEACLASSYLRCSHRRLTELDLMMAKAARGKQNNAEAILHIR